MLHCCVFYAHNDTMHWSLFIIFYFLIMSYDVGPIRKKIVQEH